MFKKDVLIRGYLRTQKVTRIKRLSLYFFEVGLFFWEFVIPNIVCIVINNGLSIWNLVVSAICLGSFKIILYIINKKFKFQENIKFTIPFLGFGILFTSGYIYYGKRSNLD